MSERDSSLAEIQEHRAKIDEIDKQIVALLEQLCALVATRWSSAV